MYRPMYISSRRIFARSRPQCRRAVDNLRPEGELLVTTELSSNFKRLNTRRPSSARDEFRKRRDNLKTGGQQGTFQAENKTSFIEHKNERPKIYKPRLCTDCHDDGNKVLEIPKDRKGKFEVTACETKTMPTVETNLVTPIKASSQYQQKFDKPLVENSQNAHEQHHNANSEVDQEIYQIRNDLWPPWSSRTPVELGEYVRSVFLDLCDGRTATELQVRPHFRTNLCFIYIILVYVSSSVGSFGVTAISQPKPQDATSR